MSVYVYGGRRVGGKSDEGRREESRRRAELCVKHRLTGYVEERPDDEVVAGIPTKTWNAATACAYRIDIDWSIDGKINEADGLADAIHEIALALHSFSFRGKV